MTYKGINYIYILLCQEYKFAFIRGFTAESESTISLENKKKPSDI